MKHHEKEHEMHHKKDRQESMKKETKKAHTGAKMALKAKMCGRNG